MTYVSNLIHLEHEAGPTRTHIDCGFFKTDGGNEPVREWLKSLKREERKTIGEDIKTVQFGWLLGMPLIRKLEPGIWEIRSSIIRGIARVLFTVEGHSMVLLHGFIKKTQKISRTDLQTARVRLVDLHKE